MAKATKNNDGLRIDGVDTVWSRALRLAAEYRATTNSAQARQIRDTLYSLVGTYSDSTQSIVLPAAILREMEG